MDIDTEVVVVPWAEAYASLEVEDVVGDARVVDSLHECLGIVGAEIENFQDVVGIGSDTEGFGEVVCVAVGAVRRMDIGTVASDIEPQIAGEVAPDAQGQCRTEIADLGDCLLYTSPSPRD